AIDAERTAERKQDAYDREPAVYVANRAYFDKLSEQLLNLGKLGADPEGQTLESIAEETRRTLGLTQESLTALRAFVADTARPPMEMLVPQLMGEIESIPALPDGRAAIELDTKERAPGVTIVRRNGAEEFRPDATIIPIPSDLRALQARVTALKSLEQFPALVRPVILNILFQNPRAFFEYDEEATSRRRKAAAEAEPAVEMIYKPNDVLIPAGKTVAEIDLVLLEHERSAYLAALGRKSWLLRAGHVGLIAVLAAGIWVYIAISSPRIMRNPTRGAAITALILLGQALAVFLTATQPTFTSASVSLSSVPSSLTF